MPCTGGEDVVHNASSSEMRRVDIGNGIVASVDQIRGQDIRTGHNIVERTRLGRRVQSEYIVLN